MLEIFQTLFSEAGLQPILTLHGLDEGKKGKGKRVRACLRMGSVYFIIEDDHALLYATIWDDCDTYSLADPQSIDKIVARVRLLNGTVLHVHDSRSNQGGTG